MIYFYQIVFINTPNYF